MMFSYFIVVAFAVVVSVSVSASYFVPTGPSLFLPDGIITDDSGKNLLAIVSEQIQVSQDYAFTWTVAPLPTMSSSGFAIY